MNDYASVFDRATLASDDLPADWIATQATREGAPFGDQICSKIAAIANSRSPSWRSGNFKLLSMTIYYYAADRASLVLETNQQCTSTPRQAPAARGGTYQISGLSVAELGDASDGYQFTTDDKTLGHVFAAGEDIRRGDFVVSIGLLSNEPIDVAELQDLTAIADAKLAAAISPGG